LSEEVGTDGIGQKQTVKLMPFPVRGTGASWAPRHL